MIDISPKLGNNNPERVIDMANKTPESKLQANARYNAKFQLIPFRVKEDGSDGFTRQDLIEAAEAAGMSMNAFIIDAILERMRHY